MSTKPKSPEKHLSTTQKAICKEQGCFDVPSTKGFCRLHYLKLLKAKSVNGGAQGNGKARGKLRVVPKKHSVDEAFPGFEPSEDASVMDRIAMLEQVAEEAEILEIDDPYQKAG